ADAFTAIARPDLKAFEAQGQAGRAAGGAVVHGVHPTLALDLRAIRDAGAGREASAEREQLLAVLHGIRADIVACVGVATRDAYDRSGSREAAGEGRAARITLCVVLGIGA